MLDEVTALPGPGAVAGPVPERRAEGRDRRPRLTPPARSGVTLPIPGAVAARRGPVAVTACPAAARALGARDLVEVPAGLLL